MLAAERLLSRKEKNKVMIVLSDGQPAGNYGGSGSDYLRYICDKIETETPIQLHGIGIQSDAVGKFYKSNETIYNLSQLEPALLNVLKRNILR